MKKIDKILMALLAGMSGLSSCDVAENRADTSGEALFVTTSGGSVWNPDTRSSSEKPIACAGEISALVEVEDWNEPESPACRGAVTGDEIEWNNTTSLSIYLTDGSGEEETLIGRNLAMNPITHVMHERYTGDLKTSSPGQKVSGSDFFWESDWSGKSKMSGNVNFYGFYPRPTNSGGALAHVKTSIIVEEYAEGKADSPWNELHYTFVDQTDENMTWHDVMCALPEESENVYGRYGNRGKCKGESVQLHFEHMFSLLDIEVARGDRYRGDCKISSMVLSGTQVFTEGTLDIKNVCIAPTRGSGGQEVKMARIFNAVDITSDRPFHTTMIVQPTQDGDAPDGTGRLVLTCCIDGVNYSCNLSTLKLESGKRYKVRLALTPAGIAAFKIWDGASVRIGDRTLKPEDSGTEITTKDKTFTVSAEKGYRIVDIFENGKSIFKEGQTEYDIAWNEGVNTNYNIVTCDMTKWYVTDGLQLHYDGIRNQYNGGGTQNIGTGVWYDLSGHDNDGTLRSFDANSGWDGKGLKFDGKNDIVYFSGKMTTSYTMEFYVCVEPEQIGAHPRFVAEGNKYPCFYFYGTSDKYDGIHSSSSNIRTIAFYDKDNTALSYPDSKHSTTICTDGKTIIQLDFTYDADSGILKWYIDGAEKGFRENVAIPESIDIASIGSRYVDNSRALSATYYGFMIYSKALTESEINNNHKVNVSRYGTSK